MMRAVDTLYTEHQVVTGDICHLWHVRPGSDWRTRHWVGQPASAPGVGVPLPRLAQRYAYATSEPTFMAGLVNEHEPARENWESPWGWLYRRGGWPGCRMSWFRDET
jgi:hypothetical protein